VAGASPLKGALRVSVIGIVVLVISHLIGKQFL
jgi:VIT1/CCC1 family predicted Fe2+/Mn2+ transporter